MGEPTTFDPTTFDPATFAPEFTNPWWGVLWYTADDWGKVAIMAGAEVAALELHDAFLQMAESLRPVFAPLLEVRDG